MAADLSSEAFAHLRLAGVTRLSLHGRGPRDAYVFDPHRLALPCWHLSLKDQGPALLLTLDRHLDLVPPAEPAAVPRASASLLEMERHTREKLDLRNVDHICAAMEAGLLTGVIAVARASPAGARGAGPYVDAAGASHPVLVAKTLEKLCDGGVLADEARALIDAAERIVLDIDLDCFSSPSDADPTTVVPWPRALIREYLFPEDSEAFWARVLEKAVCFTFAREPAHVGGLIAGGRLFEDACEVVFRELLKTDLP